MVVEKSGENGFWPRIDHTPGSTFGGFLEKYDRY